MQRTPQRTRSASRRRQQMAEATGQSAQAQPDSNEPQSPEREAESWEPDSPPAGQPHDGMSGESLARPAHENGADKPWFTTLLARQTTKTQLLTLKYKLDAFKAQRTIDYSGFEIRGVSERSRTELVRMYCEQLVEYIFARTDTIPWPDEPEDRRPGTSASLEMDALLREEAESIAAEQLSDDGEREPPSVTDLLQRVASRLDDAEYERREERQRAGQERREDRDMRAQLQNEVLGLVRSQLRTQQEASKAQHEIVGLITTQANAQMQVQQSIVQMMQGMTNAMQTISHKLDKEANDTPVLKTYDMADMRAKQLGEPEHELKAPGKEQTERRPYNSKAAKLLSGTYDQFDGEAVTSFQPWLRDIELRIAYNDAPDEIALAHIRLCLKGTARRLYDQQPPARAQIVGTDIQVFAFALCQAFRQGDGHAEIPSGQSDRP